MTAYENLLSPIRIGSTTVRNRVVSTAHGAYMDFYRPGVSPDQYVEYQQRRAQGGAGLIILQPVHAHPSSHSMGHYTPTRDDLMPKLEKMARALHRHGTTCVLQVFHYGAQGVSDARGDLQPLWSFNGMESPDGEVSHRMTSDEIEEVIAGFVEKTSWAVEAGLDGVELHGTHGYLLQQSYSPWGNGRDDQWGDPLRFGRELISAVRREVGTDPVVGLRISLDDFTSPERGGLGPDGLRDVASALVATGGLDYVNHSEGAKGVHYTRAIGSYRRPEGEWLPLVRKLKEVVDLPVIGVGRIVTPEQAEAAIARGDCDLTAMTRGLISDPDIVAKASGQVAGAVRVCVGANQGCIDRQPLAMPITCFHNPDVGRERDYPRDATAADARRVLVVGAGPGGLKAAESLARHGHQVTLVERGDSPGGRLSAIQHLGSAAALMRSVDWLVAENERLGVELLLSTEATPEFVAAREVDLVVAATGARPRAREDGVDGGPAVISVDEAVGLLAAGSELVTGGDVVLIDELGSLESLLTAEAIAQAGARVTVASPALYVGAKLGFTHFTPLMESLKDLEVRLEAHTRFVGVDESGAILRHMRTRQQTHAPAQLVVRARPATADTELADALRAAGTPVVVIGDACAPRNAMLAIREGASVLTHPALAAVTV